MAFTADTGDHKVTRSDIFLVDPTAWSSTGRRTSAVVARNRLSMTPSSNWPRT